MARYADQHIGSCASRQRGEKDGSHRIEGELNEVVIYGSNHWSIDGYRV
jgi:hypothetical protein